MKGTWDDAQSLNFKIRTIYHRSLKFLLNLDENKLTSSFTSISISYILLPTR